MSHLSIVPAESRVGLVRVSLSLSLSDDFSPARLLSP